MADREKEFELKLTVIVSGYGKQRHWVTLARSVRKALATTFGDQGLYVAAEQVRVPGGKWYDSASVVGVIEPFDYEAGA